MQRNMKKNMKKNMNLFSSSGGAAVKNMIHLNASISFVPDRQTCEGHCRLWDPSEICVIYCSIWLDVCVIKQQIGI